MNNYKGLLKIATQKLIELGTKVEFKKELLVQAPPILWFGDNLNTKEKIITIGANPSREEFLSDNKHQCFSKIDNNIPLTYLNNPRFKILDKTQSWNDILSNEHLQEEIIKSYNNYFHNNPYKWFGKKAIDGGYSYNVEGFINSLDASFFEGKKKYQCLHIDLMPFVTISDFTSILKESENHIFRDFWAKDFLENLIHAISPEIMIVFGKTNLDYLTRFMTLDKGEAHVYIESKENGKISKTNYWLFKYKSFKIIGLSVNLGNPQGFSKKTVYNLGQEILTKMYDW